MGNYNKNWDKKRKFSWKKRMKQVRNVKGQQCDENNNYRDENNNYNNNDDSANYEQIPFIYMMSEFIDIHESLSQRGDTYNCSPPNEVTGGIARTTKQTSIPTVRTGKMSERKRYKGGSPNRLVKYKSVFQ